MRKRNTYQQIALAFGVGLSTALVLYFTLSQFRRECELEFGSLDQDTLDNACHLIIENSKEACIQGFENAWQLMLNLYGNTLNCTQDPLPYPHYQSLDPNCEPYYNNSQSAQSCLFGATSAPQYFIGANQMACLVQSSCHAAVNTSTGLATTVSGLLTSLTLFSWMQSRKKGPDETELLSRDSERVDLQQGR